MANNIRQVTIITMKNLIKKLFTVFCLLTITLFSLSGCYDSRGIEDMAYAIAIGFDTAENDMIALTLQFSLPSSSSDSGSGSSQSSKIDNTTVVCSSFNSGIGLINSYISKEVNLSHCKVVVFSEEIAQKGLCEYLDTLSNNIEIRPDCNVIISKCPAKTFMQDSSPPIETLTARYYEVAVNSSEYTAYTTATELSEFIGNVKNTFVQGSAILGGINSGNNKVSDESYTGIDSSYTAGETPIEDLNNIETFGTAVFRKDTLVGELNGLETICYLITQNKLETCTLSVPTPFDGGNHSIDLRMYQDDAPKISVQTINNSPYISMDINLTAYGLTLNENVDYSSISDMDILERYSESYIKTQMEAFLYKTAKDLNSDIAGFGRYTLHNSLTIDDWNNTNWLDNYKNSFFNVNVKMRILSGSELDRSL